MLHENELFEKAPHGSDQSVTNKFLPEGLSEKLRGMYEMESDILAG